MATKNTSPDVSHTAALMRNSPGSSTFFWRGGLPGGLRAGRVLAAEARFAGLFPRKTQELFAHACAGRIAELFRMQVEYLEAVEEIIAPLRREALIDGAYDKVLVRLGGGRMPLRLLSPYETFSEETYAECKQILDEKYSSWLDDHRPAQPSN